MDAEEIFDGLKIEYIRSGHHHCRPGWVQLKECPFCASDNFHFGFCLTGGFFACWKCGGHSAWKSWIALGLSKQDAFLATRNATTGRPVLQVDTRTSIKVPKGVGKLQVAHRDYLRGRGFVPKEIAGVWGVGGIGIASRLSWRLFLPILQHDQPVSWTTRAIGSQVAQRYISASAKEEKVNHKSLIYGEDYCRHSIVIVEGPLDAWKVGPGAGALFGTAFTTAQVKRLIQHPYRYVVFDSSRAAQLRAGELAGQLAAFPGSTEIIALDAEDPGSATDKEIRTLRRVTGLS